MHKVLVNRLGGLSLPRKSVVRLTDRPDMTLDVYRGRKTTMQQQQSSENQWICFTVCGKSITDRSKAVLLLWFLSVTCYVSMCMVISNMVS